MRAYEKFLLAICGVLVLCLAVVALEPHRALVAHVGELAEQSSGASPAGGPDRGDARESGNGREAESPSDRAGGQDGAPGENPPAGPSGSSLLCVPEGASEPVYLSGGGEPAETPIVGLAADESGRFAFYGAPDPQGGGPTGDSYDILTGCYPDLAHANLASVRVEGDTAEPLSADTLTEPTRRAGDGSLVTGHRLGGVEVRQRLSLGGPGGPHGERLEVSYELANLSAAPQSVSLRSILSPPRASGDASSDVSDSASEAKADQDGESAPFRIQGPANGRNALVRNESTLTARDGAIRPVVVPRRGAASDASARWSPGAVHPDRLTLAGFHELAAADFAYQIRYSWPLPDNAALAAYWSDRGLAPGESVTFSHTYQTGLGEQADLR